ncbi:MAG: hypothetical protein PWP64_1520 [Candidatus Cloacimonadota bacterium]|nr:hypothetical protein [Candidatus Cloacimonadota bacterium]
MPAAKLQVIEHQTKVELRMADRVYTMNKSKGWGYLLELLRHPGELRYARTLVAAQHPIPDEYQMLSKLSVEELGTMNLYPQFDTRRIEMADARCIREVSARLNHLIALEAELRQHNNPAALEDLLTEKDKLSEYLYEVLRRDRRLRYFADNSDKATNSVNKALRRCLDGIAAVDPQLGAYLKQHVRVWHRLRYEPGEIEIEVFGVSGGLEVSEMGM